MTTNLTAAAVATLRALLDRDGVPDADAYWRASSAASAAVTAAVRDGVSHRAIASLTGAPGLMVVHLIDDPQLRAQALVVERQHAQQYVDEVRDAMATYARAQVGAGVMKATVAAALGVSRPTLDAWIAAGDQQAADLERGIAPA